MKRTGFRFAALAFLCLILVSCGAPSAPPPPTATPTPPSVPTSTPVTPAEPSPEGVAFQDDFSDNHNQWTTLAPDAAGNYVAVENGVYNIHAVFNQEVADGFEVPTWGGSLGLEFLNFDLRVEATKVSGPDNSEVFFIFGATDDQFKEFTYSTLGNRMVEGEYSGSIEVGELVFSSPAGESVGAINPGNATNEVRLVVLDGELSVYINGDQLLDTSDVPGDYAGGFIGFGCAPFEPGETLCTFDNLQVYEL